MAVLAGKAAVVTGGGRGLGRAYAELAAREGAGVVVNDIDRDCVDEVVAAIRTAGGEAVANHDDISSWDGSEAVIASCVDRFGRIDGLVNNAGLFYLAHPNDETAERMRAIVEVNVLGSAYCGTHALRHMLGQGSGSVVNVTSGAFAGITDMAMYGATKGAVASLTYGWAVDVDGSGVRVNAVSPIARSRMYDTMLAHKGEKGSVTAVRPEDNAAVVVFLLSDAASGINGQVVRINPPHLSLIAHPAEVLPTIEREHWTVEAVEAAFRDSLANRLEPLGLSAWGKRLVS